MGELEQKLANSPGLVALQLQGKEAGKLVSRTTQVPPGWLAVANRSDGRMAVVPAGADLYDETAGTLSVFRAGPLSLTVRAGPVRTADGHEITCQAQLRVAVRPNVNDLTGLLRQFLTRTKSQVEISDLENYLEEHVLINARVHCRARSSAETFERANALSLGEHLVAALERPLLAAGLSCVPGILMTCIPITEAAISYLPSTSNSASQEVLHKALLAQFDDLAAGAAECGEAKVSQALRKLRQKVTGQVAFSTFEQVVQVLPEKIRTELHDAMLKIFATVSVERLVAVAGSSVICWKLPETTKPAWTTVVPPDMGGGRSVRLGRDEQGQLCVLVGCQKGVLILDAIRGKVIASLLEPYRSPTAHSSGASGFNSAVLRGKQCWASKSDVGLLCWDMDRPTAPWSILGAGKNNAVRFVRSTVVDANGVIWFGGDNWLINCASGLATSPELEWFVPIDAAVTCAEIDGEDIWVGTQSGSIWRISQFDPRSVQRLDVTPGQAVESITIRRTGLVRWLVYANGKGVVVRTVNGMYERQCGGPGGIRAAKTGGAWLVGLSDWRDELCLWTCASPGREAVRINVQKLTNTRIQDFDLG